MHSPFTAPPLPDQDHVRRRPSKALHSPNNRRIRELSKFARELFPDGGGDYVLPETLTGHHLAVALITHLARASQRTGNRLVNFCRDRAPWLDPDDVDVTAVRPDKASDLGVKLGLTAALRAEARHHQHRALRSDAGRT